MGKRVFSIASFIMSMREDKPEAYFARFLDIPENQLDYREIPATTVADWEYAEVLLPVTAEEFHAIKEFIRARREQRASGGARSLR